MKINVLFVFMIFIFCGCSTSYVLHWRKDKFELWKSHDTTSEDSVINGNLGLVMTADRAPIVRTDPALLDGSGWVYYNLKIKNVSDKPVLVDLHKLHILFENYKSDAVLEKEEKQSKLFKMDGKTSYGIPVKFYLKTELIQSNKGKFPLKLVLPLENNDEVSMELWLWHV